MPRDSPTPKQKPHAHPKPYARKQRLSLKAQNQVVPGTSAVLPQREKHSNLTLSDWLTIVAYYDEQHPMITHREVVDHFAKRPEGALLFNQASLSRHLSASGRTKDQAQLASNPTALSAKRI